MSTISIIKYGNENTVTDYGIIRDIAYKENIDNNILVGTIEHPKYNLYLNYLDEICVGFWGYKRSKKDQLSHNYTIENLYIKKELQWQWLMWKLYEHMENEILKDDNVIVRLEAKVTETNERSLKFFEKHWFYQYWFAKNRIYDKNNGKYVWTILLEKII